MTEDQLKAFLAKIQADPILAEKVRAAPDAESYAALAREAGVMISAHEVESARAELSEAELEGAGTRSTTYPTQSCRNTCKSGCTCSAILDESRLPADLSQ
ncbi:MAG: hypothetical protein Tsb0019_24700 [Roseibium sp.]